MCGALIVALFLPACGGSQPLSGTAAASMTPVPLPSRTFQLLVPTLSPTPFKTPTSPPLPIARNTVALSPLAISTSTADQIALLANLGKGRMGSVIWWADGAALAVIGSLGVYEYDTENLAETDFINIGVNGAFAVSSDSRWLAIEAGDVQLLDIQTGERAAILPGRIYGGANGLAFSPDGRLLAAAGRAFGGGDPEYILEVWDVSTGKTLLDLQAYMEYESNVAFSPDSRTIAIGGEHGVRLLDARSGQLLRTFDQALGNYVAFSPDGTILVSGIRYFGRETTQL